MKVDLDDGEVDIILGMIRATKTHSERVGLERIQKKMGKVTDEELLFKLTKMRAFSKRLDDLAAKLEGK